MTQILQGTLTLPGDKSISHRSLMLLGLAKGQGRIENLSSGQDVMSTLACMKALGVMITPDGENAYRVEGRSELVAPLEPLDCGNSGTTIRLLSGILAGANVSATLVGDASLSKRPMKRVITPLKAMGADMEGQGEHGCTPLHLKATATGLHGIDYPMPMASAQVKSAILLAGLFTPPTESVVVRETVTSRDHSERMLTALGCPVETVGTTVTLKGRQSDLVAQDIYVSGDISSAAFWLVGGAILPGSDIRINKVGLNPSRLGVLDVLKQAGVNVEITNETHSAGEPMGDLLLKASPLKGDINITADMVPALIDEIPILTVLGLFTDGRFTVRGAEELRFKESDRLGSLIHILETFGVEVESSEDGMTFQGSSQWQMPVVESTFETHHDHRLVMALEILNLRATTPLSIEGKEWVGISYPGFYDTLQRLCQTPLSQAHH